MKKLGLIMMFAFVLFLSACTLLDSENDSSGNIEEEDPIDLSKEVLYHNLESFGLGGEVQASTTSVEETLYDGDGSIDRYYRDEGLFIIEDTDGDRGVWTLAEGDFLVEPEDGQTVSVSTNNHVGAIIEITTESTNSDPDDLEVIDIGGNTVLEKDAYASWDIDWHTNQEEDTIETIEYLSEEDEEAGEEPTEEMFVVDFETGDRSAYDEDAQESEYEKGDTYEGFRDERTDLEPYGLENHTLSRSEWSYRVYDEDEQVASFQGPPLDSSSSPAIMMDGHFIYQTSDTMPEPSEDYTYITRDGTKILLRTYAIDMATGERSTLDVDYVLESVEEFKDEDGLNRYAYSTIIPIAGEVLEQYRSRVIIDAEGSIRKNVNGMNLMDLTWIQEKPEEAEDVDEAYRLLNTESMMLLDSELNELYTLGNESMPSIDDDGNFRGFFIEEEGLWGAVDEDGSVVLPFMFDDIDEAGFIGNTLLAWQDDKPVLVDRDEDITPIDGYVLDLFNESILVIEETEDEESFYEIKVLDINNDEELSILSDTGSYDRSNMTFNNPFFGSHRVYHFSDSYYDDLDPQEDAVIVIQGE
ncbi:MAG: hypothetical protein ACOC14_01440 [Bacillota bacterium]